MGSTVGQLLTEMAELWGSRQIGMIKFAQGQRLFTANYRVMRTTLLFLITFFLSVYASNGQGRRKDRSIMKDTLDGKLDFSRYMVDAKGFLPIPLVITEPALGSFGFVIAPVFLTPKKNVPKNFGYVAPDITAGFGMYTANGSWALGGARIGSIPTKGIKYRFGAVYANVNLSFYRTLSNGSEVETEFNMKTLPVFGSISKKITRNGLYLGVQYALAKVDAKPIVNGDIPEFITPKELESKVGTLGTFLDWDKRNSIFTPDKGLRTQLLFTVNDNWTASDYDYQKLGFLMNWFAPLKPGWVSGLRLEWEQVFGDVPFFLMPGLVMRGIPFARYQGEAILTAETEQRFDINTRWSIVGFLGYGRTFSNSNFIQPEQIVSGGAGFRYLLARSFRLRTGIDVAAGPDSWGWYIVFGHNWNR